MARALNKYMLSKQAKESAALSAPVRRSDALEVMDAFLKTTTGKGIDAMIEEHMEEAEDASLEHLAETLTNNIVARPPGADTFMLMEPIQLTVKRANKPGDGYSKRPHIGGENFRPLRCYAGKRNKLIYVFKPLEVADYVEMEMDEEAAKKSLGGFTDFLKQITDFDLQNRLKNAQDKASLDAEREKLADRHEVYSDQGFGSW